MSAGEGVEQRLVRIFLGAADEEEVGGGSRLDAADFVEKAGELGGDAACHLDALGVGEHFGVLAVVPFGGVLELLQHAVAAAGAPVGGESDFDAGLSGGGDVGCASVEVEVRRGDQGRGRITSRQPPRGPVGEHNSLPGGDFRHIHSFRC